MALFVKLFCTDVYFWTFHIYFWTPGVYATHPTWPQFFVLYEPCPWPVRLYISVTHCCLALLPSHYLSRSCVCLGSKSECCGSGEVGLWGLLAWEEGVGQPWDVCLELGLLCSKEGSGQHPHATRRGFSGTLKAAGNSWKWEWKEDLKKVSLFWYSFFNVFSCYFCIFCLLRVALFWFSILMQEMGSSLMSLWKALAVSSSWIWNPSQCLFWLFFF